jgi:hypothetical protein
MQKSCGWDNFTLFKDLLYNVKATFIKLCTPPVHRSDSCAGSGLVGMGRLPPGLPTILVVEAVLRRWCGRKVMCVVMEVRFGFHFVVHCVWRLGRRADSKAFVEVRLYANLFPDLDWIQ